MPDVLQACMAFTKNRIVFPVWFIRLVIHHKVRFTVFASSKRKFKSLSFSAPVRIGSRYARNFPCITVTESICGGGFSLINCFSFAKIGPEAIYSESFGRMCLISCAFFARKNISQSFSVTKKTAIRPKCVFCGIP